MRDLIEKWEDGVSYLIGDDLISYYAFFTVIFAECAYLWGHYDVETAYPFTLILCGYIVNVIVFGLLKRWAEDFVLNRLARRNENDKSKWNIEMLVISIGYLFVFAVLFLFGCMFNFKLSIVLTIIPFVVTWLWVFIRDYQCSTGAGIKIIRKLLSNNVILIISELIVICAPFFAFAFCLSTISSLSVILKVIIVIGYVFCIPFIPYFEDEICYNVFEIAYEDLKC